MQQRLRSAKFTVPLVWMTARKFVFLDCSAIGLGSVFLHLGAKLNWHRAFEALIEGFDPDNLARGQREILKQTGVPEAA